MTDTAVYPTVTWYYHDGTQWVDISAYVFHRSGESGRYGCGNKPLDRLARTGELNFTLDNRTGRFDPDDTDCLTGWGYNTKVKLVVSYEGYSKTLWYGSVSKIRLNDNVINDHTASVTVVDWLDYAYRFTITQQSIETYRRGGQVVDTIIDAVGQTPQATEYAVGDYEFEAAFDSMTVKTKAATELNKIVLSEGGFFYNRHDRTTGEKLVFENAAYRGGLRTLSKLPELSTSYLLKAGSATDKVLLAGTTDKVLLNTVTDAHMNGIGERYERSHGENILNKVKITAYPKRTDSTEQTLYSLGDVLKIVSGETKTINVRYQNADTKESCNAITSLMIQPVATTDYLMNTKKDGTGTNITSDLTVSVVFRTAEAEITLTNSSAYVGKITKLQLRGYGVYQDSSIKAVVEDTASQASYSEAELNIEQQYQRDTVAGKAWADKIVAGEKNPRTVLNKVTFIANKSETRMLAFLALDIGDLVRITESGLNIDGYYYINGVEFAITAGNIITYSWILSEALPSVYNGALTLASMEFTDSNSQSINFGTIDKITDEDELTIIMSVYPHQTDNNVQILISYGSYDVTEPINGYFRIGYVWDVIGGTGAKIDYTSLSFSGGTYSCYSDCTNAIPINEWRRIAITINTKSLSQSPLFYIDSVIKPTVITSVGSGSYVSGMVNPIIVGGNINADGTYDNNFDGLLKNVLIYNTILTPDEIAADAASPGSVTRGLVFRGLCIPTSQTADYYDAALTTSQLLFDDINGVSGIPRGTPTCREIT